MYMPNTFLRFLNLSQAIKETTPEWPALDAVEERLIMRLSAAWFMTGPMTIAAATKLLDNTSPGTAHTKINNLIKKGLIETFTDENDKRIKKITPTQLTINYFNKLDSYLSS